MRKIMIFKHKRRKDYRKKQGHRQVYRCARGKYRIIVVSESRGAKQKQTFLPKACRVFGGKSWLIRKRAEVPETDATALASAGA